MYIRLSGKRCSHSDRVANGDRVTDQEHTWQGRVVYYRSEGLWLILC